MNMAFGQTEVFVLDSWGVAPGYDEHGRWPIMGAAGIDREIPPQQSA